MTPGRGQMTLLLSAVMMAGVVTPLTPLRFAKQEYRPVDIDAWSTFIRLITRISMWVIAAATNMCLRAIPQYNPALEKSMPGGNLTRAHFYSHL